MIKFIKDIRGSEPDILTPVKDEVLRVVDLDGRLICKVDCPLLGWTEERLWQESEKLQSLTQDGADAYLGRQWVGSTEI